MKYLFFVFFFILFCNENKAIKNENKAIKKEGFILNQVLFDKEIACKYFFIDDDNYTYSSINAYIDHDKKKIVKIKRGTIGRSLFDLSREDGSKSSLPMKMEVDGQLLYTLGTDTFPCSDEKWFIDNKSHLIALYDMENLLWKPEDICHPYRKDPRGILKQFNIGVGTRYPSEYQRFAGIYLGFDADYTEPGDFDDRKLKVQRVKNNKFLLKSESNEFLVDILPKIEGGNCNRLNIISYTGSSETAKAIENIVFESYKEKNKNSYEGNKNFGLIKAKTGLFLRQNCESNSEKIILIPDKSTVEIIKEDREDIIDELTSNWLWIKYEEKEGCSFGGFIEKK